MSVRVIRLAEWRQESRQYGHPVTECSEGHFSRIQYHAERLVAPVDALLTKHNYRILAIREMSDYKNEWQTTQASGYSKGKTFEHVGGVTLPRANLILIAEYEKRGNAYVRIDYFNRFQYIFEHELGHAIDFLLGISKSEKFLEKYWIDASSLPRGIDRLLSYFVQEKERGPRETVAELFCSRGSLGIAPQHFKQYFKRSCAVLEEELNKAGIQLPKSRQLGLLEESISSINLLTHQAVGEFFSKAKTGSQSLRLDLIYTNARNLQEAFLASGYDEAGRMLGDALQQVPAGAARLMKLQEVLRKLLSDYQFPIELKMKLQNLQGQIEQYFLFNGI